MISENGSNGSGKENNSGTGGTNLAYLDSESGNRNISGGTGMSHGPGSGSGANGNNNVQYIPIMIVCCPNLMKNEPCFCGY